MKRVWVYVWAAVALAGCGKQQTLNSRNADAGPVSHGSAPAAPPKTCASDIAELAEAQCAANVYLNLSKRDTLTSDIQRAGNDAQGRLEAVEAKMLKSGCASQVDQAEKLGHDATVVGFMQTNNGTLGMDCTGATCITPKSVNYLLSYCKNVRTDHVDHYCSDYDCRPGVPANTPRQSNVAATASAVIASEAPSAPQTPASTPSTQPSAPQAAAPQQGYAPPPGSPERKAIMDAMRPRAEQIAKQPVIFKVVSLTVTGNHAHAVVVPLGQDGQPARPYGQPFTLAADLERNGNGWTLTNMYEDTGDE